MCVCVCVQLPRTDCLLCFSIENASKRLDYPAVVYHGAVPAFCRCSVLSSDRKVAARSQGGETRPNRGAIDRCHLQISSKAYSSSSYKCGACVGFWRHRTATVCLASVNWCIFHVKQLLSSRRPRWHSLGASLKNQCQTLALRLHHAIYCYKCTYAQLN